MAKVNEQEMALARVYSSAMWDVAEGAGQADALLAELSDLAAYLDKNTEFGAFLSNPTVEADTRKKLLEKLFRGRYSDTLVDSLQVLNGKDRLNLLRSVAESYRLLHEEHRRHVEVFVRTAVPLTDSLRGVIRDAAAKRTGRQAILVETVDPSVIGGLIVHIGDEKYDMSVSMLLRAVYDKLLDRASREIHGGRAFREGSLAA